MSHLWAVDCNSSLRVVLGLSNCCLFSLCLFFFSEVSYSTFFVNCTHTFLSASLALHCWFVWFSLMDAFGILFIRLDGSLPFTLQVTGRNVTAAVPSKSRKTLHSPVRFSGFISVRIVCFCGYLLWTVLSVILWVTVVIVVAHLVLTTNCSALLYNKIVSLRITKYFNLKQSNFWLIIQS